MTKIIVGWDVAVAEWVRRELSFGDDYWGPCRALGIIDDDGGELIAGIVYNNFRWPNIEASIASTTPRWCSRRNLAAIFAFPFCQLRVHRLGATTAAENTAAQQFLRRLGFRQEGVARRALVSGDAVAFGMLAEECGWLPPAGLAAAGANGRTNEWPRRLVLRSRRSPAGLVPAPVPLRRLGQPVAWRLGSAED